MRIAVKHIENNIYFDSKQYWIKISDRFYGYDKLRGVFYDHICKPEGEFTEILPPSEQHLKSSQISKRKAEPKIVTDTSKIAPRDIDKPGKYITDEERAYQSLVGGD